MVFICLPVDILLIKSQNDQKSFNGMFNVQKIHLDPMSSSGSWSRAPFSDALINCVHWSDNLLSPTSSNSVFRFCSCLGLRITHRWTLIPHAGNAVVHVNVVDAEVPFLCCTFDETTAVLLHPQQESVWRWSSVKACKSSFLSLQLSDVWGNALKFSCLLYNKPISSLRVTVKTDLCAG